MTSYSWKDADHDCHYYFKDENGLIVGQVHKIAHTKIFIAVAIIINEEKSERNLCYFFYQAFYLVQ